jgi:hypothetical protein
MKTIRLSFLALVILGTARADSIIYDVTLDTGPLIGDAAGPFSIGFEFVDGSGIGDGNNLLFMSNFNFGAGGPSGLPLTFGSVGGDLSSSVVMTDAAPDNIFVQSFVPGNTLSFLLNMTTNVDAGPTPDEFIMSILDNTFTPIPTTAGSPLSPFLQIDIDSSNPTVETFSSDPTQPPAGGGGPISIGQPTVSTVPEPSGAVFYALPVLYFVWATRRRARKRSGPATASRGVA